MVSARTILQSEGTATAASSVKGAVQNGIQDALYGAGYGAFYIGPVSFLAGYGMRRGLERFGVPNETADKVGVVYGIATGASSLFVPPAGIVMAAAPYAPEAIEKGLEYRQTKANAEIAAGERAGPDLSFHGLNERAWRRAYRWTLGRDPDNPAHFVGTDKKRKTAGYVFSALYGAGVRSPYRLAVEIRKAQVEAKFRNTHPRLSQAMDAFGIKGKNPLEFILDQYDAIDATYGALNPANPNFANQKAIIDSQKAIIDSWKDLLTDAQSKDLADILEYRKFEQQLKIQKSEARAKTAGGQSLSYRMAHALFGTI